VDTAPPLPEGSHGVLHAEEDTLGVDAHEGVPMRGTEGVAIVRAADPRVVHEDVDASISAHRGLDRLLPVELARHVELDELRLAAVAIDLLCPRPPARLHHPA